MWFQKLVFRTIPHSLVEWLDGELEKRGIDCVYTHPVLSILQGDSDDIESDEYIDVKNNQQKAFHKYGDPESLFSATKSKHQKWKTYSKQTLLTTSLSGSDSGISDLEQKNKIAAVNCLKSVSDDNSIEDLIEELCLKLKNINTINAPEKKDSPKSLKIIDKDTPFYIPPSSPTDQVEKYFAAFPSLDRKIEEKTDLNVAHLNAWNNNCIGKNKSIVQDIFKKSNLNSFQSSEISIFKQSGSYGLLKPIENIYESKNNFDTSKNLGKITFPNIHDENDYNQFSAKNIGSIGSNSFTFTNSENEDLKTQMCNNMSLSKATEKLRNEANKINIEIQKYDSDPKRKCMLLGTTTYQLPSDFKSDENMASKIACPVAESTNILRDQENKMRVEIHKSESNSKRKSLLIGTTDYLPSISKNVKNKTSVTSKKSSIDMEEENIKITFPASETTDKLKNQTNKMNIAIYKFDSDVKRKSLLLGTTDIPSISKNVKSKTGVNAKKSLIVEEENTKTTSHLVKKDTEKLINCDTIFKEIVTASDIPCKKFKWFEEVTKFKTENKCSSENEKMHELQNCAEEVDKIRVHKKVLTDSKKSKSAKRKVRVSHCTFKNNINSTILGSENEHFSSVDVKRDNICVTKTGNCKIEKMDESASEMHFSALDSFRHKDKSYKKEMNTVDFLKNNINKDTCSVEEINYAGSNAIVCDKSKMQSVSLEKSSIKSFKEKNSHSINDTEEISDTSVQLPLYLKDISHQNFMVPLENINLIIIDNNIYYNFNPQRASCFFSPHEIFNIITIGDEYKVKKFLRKFSLQTEFDLDSSQNSDVDSQSNNDFVSENQDTKYFKFKIVQSKNYADCTSMMKFSSPSLHLENGSENKVTSVFADNHQLVDSKNTNSCKSSGCFEDVQFYSSNSQKEITEQDTSTYFGNWNYNVFFDFYKQKAGNLNNCDHLNDINSTFLCNDSFNEKTVSGDLPNKQDFNENDCRIYSEQELYVKNESICARGNEVTDNDYVFSPAYKSSEFKEKYLLSQTENQPQNKFLNFLQCDTVGVNNTCENRVDSAFKVVHKTEEPHPTNNLSRNKQNILKKIINIDRVIHQINAKNRVTSFLNLQDKAFTIPLDSSKELGISNFMSCNSYDSKFEFLHSKNYNYPNFSDLYSTSDRDLRSIWEGKNSSLQYIWRNSPMFVECKNIFPIVSDSSDLDKIHKEFEEEQEELLKDVYSLPDFKKESNLYSENDSICNQIYENTYTLNIGSGNESLAIDAKEFSEISVSMHDTMPMQTVLNTQDDHKSFDCSLSVPHDEPPVDVYSLGNSNHDMVYPQITCSDINYKSNMKNGAYQDSDFIDLSAFRGPYGHYSESESNCIADSRWSPKSDSYFLESDDFHDQSSPLQNLNITGSENGSFQSMPLERQQLSSEDEEMTQMNATQWFRNNMRRHIKYKCPASKRPCTFYMEGNCNRSNCKFSHDLCNITCRFWQEGSCFKGSTCPFLHGYADNQKITDQHHSIKKSELESNYCLDSEADFPSLTVAKSEKTPVVNSEPLDIVHEKEFENLKQINH